MFPDYAPIDLHEYLSPWCGLHICPVASYCYLSLVLFFTVRLSEDWLKLLKKNFIVTYVFWKGCFLQAWLTYLAVSNSAVAGTIVWMNAIKLLCIWSCSCLIFWEMLIRSCMPCLKVQLPPLYVLQMSDGGLCGYPCSQEELFGFMEIPAWLTVKPLQILASTSKCHG